MPIAWLYKMPWPVANISLLLDCVLEEFDIRVPNYTAKCSKCGNTREVLGFKRKIRKFNLRLRLVQEILRSAQNDK